MKKHKVQIPVPGVGLRVVIYALTILAGIGSVADVAFGFLPVTLRYLVYSMAALLLALSCYYLYFDIRHLVQDILLPAVRRNAFANRMTEDYVYNTVLCACLGLIPNAAFAVTNGVVGVYTASAWSGSLAAYYLILTLMRMFVLGFHSRNGKSAWKLYRFCGVMFVLMSTALGGAVVLMVRSGNGKDYPGFLIYAVAAYTFLKMGTSIKNLIQAKRYRNPVVSILRDIGYADALVSLLTLQTALFAAFGQDNTALIPVMNGITGSVVCIAVLVLGIYMICKARTT